MNKLIVLIIILFSSLFFMALFRICPPNGPWLMPPWCMVKDVSVIVNQSITLPQGDWVQLFMPDKYAGSEYVSGNNVELINNTFTPVWPGVYKFKSGDQVIRVIVSPKQSFIIRGVSFGYWHYTKDKARYVPEVLDRLRSEGVNLVMFAPTWYMPNYSSNNMVMCPLEVIDYDKCRGVINDDTLVWMIREAHKRGLAVSIKPHLKVFDENGMPGWPGNSTPTNWSEWFNNWGGVVLHYAELAEQEGVEHLAVGSETAVSLNHTSEWVELISKVRSVYHGNLTYHGFIVSNNSSFEWAYPSLKAEFWDKLDYIGVNYWARATNKRHPSVDEMEEGINWWLNNTVIPLAHKYGKPVVITEFGTTSYDGSNIDFYNSNGVLDNGEQAEFYEAGFRAFSSHPEIIGVIVWAVTWEPATYNNPFYITMNPLSKPAEEVIKAWYTQ